MKVILGIGNPGVKYEGTRHNAGFRVVDGLAAELGVEVSRRRFASFLGEARLGDEKVLLVKPRTYVNESGRAAAGVLGYYRLEPSNMLVVSDDAALPPGKLRFARSGSSGGHGGLESIIGYIGREFHRLRIGIGSPEGEMIGHVLGRPSPEEAEVLAEAEAVAVRAVEDWVREGLDACMNRYNGMTIGPHRREEGGDMGRGSHGEPEE